MRAILLLVIIVFSNTAFATYKILLNHCQVSTRYQLELNRLSANKDKILAQCIQQGWPYDSSRCESDYQWYFDNRSDHMRNSKYFFDKYDWAHAQYVIEPDTSDSLGIISSTVPWLFNDKVYPLTTTGAKLISGGGAEKTYEQYSKTDLENNAIIGPGYSSLYDIYNINLPSDKYPLGRIEISIFNHLRTKRQRAIVIHSNTFENFECDVSRQSYIH